MLLWTMGVAFDNTCTVSANWNVSRVIPTVYQVNMMQRLELHKIKVVTQVRLPRKTKYEVLFDEVCVQNQWKLKIFILFLGTIESSENSMLLLTQGWLLWHYFVLGCFAPKSVDVGWGQYSIFVFLALSRDWGNAVSSTFPCLIPGERRFSTPPRVVENH